MDNALMVGLSRQMTLRRAMEITANNMANMNTPGFKLETPALETVQERPATHQIGPDKISFVREWAVVRDFSVGDLAQTGRPLDLALDGDGFFAVDVAGEELYTRDGRFALDADGLLVTDAGHPVLDDAGGQIVLPTAQGAPTIDPTGAIRVGGVDVARIGVTAFDDLAQLAKRGDGLFEAGAALPVPVETEMVRQGFTENSNVNGVLEMTRMIEVSRAYESVTRMIKSEEDLKKSAIERLGRLS